MKQRGARAKNVTLTREAREKIQEFADSHYLSFSAAIEWLALTGLGMPSREAVELVMISTIEAVMRQQYNRFAKLNAFAAMEAGQAARLSAASLRLLVQNRRKAVPGKDWQDTIFDSDPPGFEGADDAYDHIKKLTRRDTAYLLKQKEFFQDLLKEMQDIQEPQEARDGREKNHS